MLGQLYRSAAVRGATADLPPARRPDEWAAQPGTRAPHLDVRSGGGELSLLGLFQRDWVLLSEDRRWADAATRAADESGIDLTFVHIGGAVVPHDLQSFRAAYGVEADGATLIRPDGYIAWRTVTAPDDPTTALTGVLGGVAAAVNRPPAEG